MKPAVRAQFHMMFIFAISNILALVLLPAYHIYRNGLGEAGKNPWTPIYYLIYIILVTALILLIARWGKVKLLKAIFYFAIAWSMWYAIFPLLFYFRIPFSDLISLGISILLTLWMLKNPEWYVMNFVGVLVTVGISLILGLSLSIIPAVVLLSAFAIYDAVAVHMTKHMVVLADNVIEHKLPAMFVLPGKKGYSFKKVRRIKKESTGERAAYYMGFGDVLIPGVLVISAANTFNLEAGIFVLLGSLLSMLFLIAMVNRGKPQPGLPFLNAGALGGLLLYLLLTGS